MKPIDMFAAALIILLAAIYIIDYKTQQNKNKGFEIEICITQAKSKHTLAPHCSKHMSNEFLAVYEPIN